MPYKKYYKKRNYRRRRKPLAWYNKCVGTPKSLAVSALKGVRYLKGLVNSELHKESFADTLTVTTTGNVIHLTAITQGDGDNGRTGNSILLKSIFGRINVLQNSGAASTFYRMMVVCDKQQIGDTSPTIAQILDGVNVISPLNNETVGRFSICWSRNFSTDNFKGSTKGWKINLRFQQHVRYNGSAGSDIQKGGVYLILLSDLVS